MLRPVVQLLIVVTGLALAGAFVKMPEDPENTDEDSQRIASRRRMARVVVAVLFPFDLALLVYLLIR